ncbi:MAG: hypothetical protein ACXWTK_02270, partial [Methylobacter sp.]
MTNRKTLYYCWQTLNIFFIHEIRVLIMSFRKLCFNFFLCLALILFVAGLLAYISYKKDMLLLKSIVHAHISTQYSPTLFESANHWVYQNQGFKKNTEFFLFPYLGPTPVQVLE